MKNELKAKIADLADVLKDRNLKVATAESCTGGMIAAALTELPGASDWVDRGFVTYNNTAKHEMLGVSQSILEKYGAVSNDCVAQMVVGALKNSNAQVAVAVSGIAGPGGEEPGKPVGTVFLGWGLKDEMPNIIRFHFEGDRQHVREQCVEEAVNGLLDLLKG